MAFLFVFIDWEVNKLTNAVMLSGGKIQFWDVSNFDPSAHPRSDNAPAFCPSRVKRL